MLAEVQPTLLAAEIRIARVGPGREQRGDPEYREAA